MKRATIPRGLASALACAALIGLTLMTWRVSGHSASGWMLSALALLKITIIGAVFLELDRSRPRWAVAFVGYFAAVLSAAAWLMSG